MENGPGLKIYFLFNMGIFHCYVSLPEGIEIPNQSYQMIRTPLTGAPTSWIWNTWHQHPAKTQQKSLTRGAPGEISKTSWDGEINRWSIFRLWNHWIHAPCSLLFLKLRTSDIQNMSNSTTSPKVHPNQNIPKETLLQPWGFHSKWALQDIVKPSIILHWYQNNPKYSCYFLLGFTLPETNIAPENWWLDYIGILLMEEILGCKKPCT